MRPEDFRQGITVWYTNDRSPWTLMEIDETFVVVKSPESEEVRLFRMNDLTLERPVDTDGLFAASVGM